MKCYLLGVKRETMVGGAYLAHNSNGKLCEEAGAVS